MVFNDVAGGKLAAVPSVARVGEVENLAEIDAEIRLSDQPEIGKLVRFPKQPVVKFLEEDGEILAFLESVYKLADFHVKRFIDRGFTNLMFAFGCTGGQHRSVYSAQHLAEHLNQKFGIEVHICHREQNITQTLK